MNRFGSGSPEPVPPSNPARPVPETPKTASGCLTSAERLVKIIYSDLSRLIEPTREPALETVSRTIVITLLLSILASCRILCATSACACDHGTMHSYQESQGDQVPHPVNDDHCLCNGGLQVSDATGIVADLDPCLAILPIDLPYCPLGFVPLPAECPARLSAVFENLARGGDPSEACARLQLFRC